jgi:predicted amidophosphoribosyltransferase
LATHAGAECATEIIRMVGKDTFKCIVPVPCGHSCEAGHCLSLAFARAIGAEMDLPVINAFAHLEQKSSSHPKQNLKRAKMRLLQSVPGPAIVVDDVATSGMHIEEATTLLKDSGVNTFSIVWIGGVAS